TVNGLLDWSYGGQLYNGTRQWAFQATRDRVQDQAGKPQNAPTCGTAQSDPAPGSCPRKALPYYGVGFYNGLDPDDYFIENGSYAKLKELSLSYTFVADQLHRLGWLRGFHEVRLGFIARNLFTITKYSGLDPEVSGLYGDPFQVRMDWFQYPQFRTFATAAEISFWGGDHHELPWRVSPAAVVAPRRRAGCGRAGGWRVRPERREPERATYHLGQARRRR